MKTRLIGILSVVLSLLLSTCGGEMRYEGELNQAEALMEEHPDSALAILNSVRPSSIASIENEEERARFALLYSQALDKNYIDLASDSIISIAVDYYNNNGSPEQQFLSLFYLGRVKENANDYLNAIAAYTQAEQNIAEFENDYIKGLLYTRLAVLYEMYFDYPKFLNASKTAYSYYFKAGKKLHQNYAMLGQAQAFRYMNDFHNSEQMYQKLIKSAETENDTTLIITCLGDLMIQYFEQRKNEDATYIYDMLAHKYGLESMSSTFFVKAAMLHIYNGDLVKADMSMDRAKQRVANNSDSISLYMTLSEINYYIQNYKEAFDNFYKGVSMQNNQAIRKLQQPLLTSKCNYLSEQLKYDHLKVEKEQQIKQLLYLIIILIGIVGILVLAVLRKRLQLKNNLINESFDEISILKSLIAAKNKELADNMSEIFKAQFKTINDIGSRYYNFVNDINDKNRIFSEVKGIITKFNNNKKYNELEKAVNNHYDNIMFILRSEITNLSEIEYRQYCFY